jgi:TPR repeat protein
MFRLFLTVIGAGLLVGGALMLVRSDPAEELQKAQYQARIRVLVPLVEKGDFAAQLELANLYRAGLGIQPNPRKAFELYSRAAENGNATARHALGSMFENGEGVTRDVYKAARWYRLAAMRGNSPQSEFALANLYYSGRGVRQDYSEAKAYYLKAARNGHPAAQYIIGGMYADGWGGQRDLIEAYAWYSLAITKAAEAMAVNVDFDPAAARASLAKQMTRFDIGRAEQKVRAWTKGR